MLLGWGAVVLLAAAGLPGLSIDNAPERFFPRQVRALDDYRELRQLFGRDRALRIGLSGPGLWTAEGLRWEGRLEQELRALRGVVGAAGLAFHHGVGDPGCTDSGWPPKDPAALRRRALDDPLDRNAGWIGENGESAGILVVLWNLDAARQAEVLSDIDALVAEPPAGIEVAVSGLPVLQRALDAEVVRFAWRFFPWLAVIAAGALALAFRDLGSVLRVLAYVGGCLVVVLGATGWAGLGLDAVTVVLLPLVFVIALATAVHVVVRYRQVAATRRSARAAVRATFREKGWPVLWSGVTTAAGFGSLAVSRSPPVALLGIWSAFAMMLITAAAVTLLPALLAGRRPGALPRPAGFEALGRRRGECWAAWAVRRRRLVAGAAAIVAALALAGSGGWRPDPGPLTYLAPDHPVRADSRRLAERGLPPVSAELVLRTSGDPGTAFDSPATLAELGRLTRTLRRELPVLTALGPAEVIAYALPGEVPGDDEAVRRRIRLLREAEESAPLLAAVLTADARAARLSLGLPMGGHAELAPVFAAAEARAQRAFPRAEVSVTGQYPLVLTALHGVLRTMLLSLTLTLMVVSLLFVALFRRPRLVLAALAPNLFPVAFVLGAMGWLRVPLDGGTVMIAATVLGLAVDDTLHGLAAAVRSARAGMAPGEAAVSALRRTAPAHLLTTLLLAVGFGLCALSPFLPVARFGAFTTIGLLAALAADLLLVPALIAGVPAAVLSLSPPVPATTISDRRAPADDEQRRDRQ